MFGMVVAGLIDYHELLINQATSKSSLATLKNKIVSSW